MSGSLLLKEQSVVCLSSGTHAPAEGLKPLLDLLATQGNRILWIQTDGAKSFFASGMSFRQMGENFYAYRPLRVPLVGRWLTLQMVRRWLRLMEWDGPILWVAHPDPLVLPLMKRFPHRLVVYQCFSPGSVGQVERRILSRAQMVFAPSRELRARCSPHHPRVYTIPWDNSSTRPDFSLADELSCLIQGELEVLRLEREGQWEKRWAEYLKASFRRVTQLTLGLALGYLLIFQTPLVWWLARPLKVVEPPRQADAIVVLAAGVGESGQPGQGYEERVARGVELYRMGYAPLLIFASGYAYRFRETEVMRALAISLEVPREAILLEDRGRNTYELAKNLAALLRNRGATSALLVSSPYHMRRALLTFQRQASEILWTSTPVTQSLFYGEEGKILFRHLRALAHEILAIAYYRMKGWL